MSSLEMGNGKSPTVPVKMVFVLSFCCGQKNNAFGDLSSWTYYIPLLTTRDRYCTPPPHKNKEHFITYNIIMILKCIHTILFYTAPSTPYERYI